MELVWLKKHKIDENDYSTMFMRLNHMNIDSLILYTSSETASLQIRQLRQAGFRGAVCAGELANSEELSGGDAAEGVVYACGYPFRIRLLKRLRRRRGPFGKIYPTLRYNAGWRAYRGYDAMMLLVEAMRRGHAGKRGYSGRAGQHKRI